MMTNQIHQNYSTEKVDAHNTFVNVYMGSFYPPVPRTVFSLKRYDFGGSRSLLLRIGPGEVQECLPSSQAANPARCAEDV